ncbi:MAG TPA: glycosyltransferase [Acidimicrobiales bacterium]|jgi:glycosyltransferase involved in cell wall biosynthesis|nr:glycosyltransferase [Acidimicrobiales bacterium]
MRQPDVAMISPYPGQTDEAAVPSGVAVYTERLASALTEEGMEVRVVAPEIEGEPSLSRAGGVTIERGFRRGATALPRAARRASRSQAPLVHVQHETFLYGGPSAIPGVIPALAGIRMRHQGPVVTMHQVVDPATVDHQFTVTHRVDAPHQLARAGLAGVQGSVRRLGATTIVHERAFTKVMPEAVVVPHGIDAVAAAAAPEIARAKRAFGARPDRLTALCFGFLAPYKGFEVALQAAALAGERVDLVVAGGSHPRLHGRDPYAEDLRRRFGDVARFVGYVPDAKVKDVFRAADVLLLPYAAPFASSGPFAHALAYGTPVLCSPPLAQCVDAPDSLVAPLEPQGLAHRLRQLAHDASALHDLSADVRTLARGRSWREVARLHIALYEEVIDASRTRGRGLRPRKPRG